MLSKIEQPPLYSVANLEATVRTESFGVLFGFPLILSIRANLHAANSTGYYPLSGTASRPFRVQPTALGGYGGHYIVTTPSVADYF